MNDSFHNSGPDSIGDLHIQLERLLDVGRTREARQLLHTGLSRAPGDPELHVFSARIAFADGDTHEARKQVEHALQNAPNHFNARLVLYDLEMADKNHPQAEQVLTGLIRENPENAALLALYARLMLLSFHLEKSRALVDEALRRDPDNETARLVDVLLSTVEGNSAWVDAQLSDLVADDPENELIAHTLLMTLIEQGRNREALQLAQQLLRNRPDDSDLLELLVNLRVQTHPLALPLYPTQKFGWAGSAASWLAVMIIVNIMRGNGNKWTFLVSISYILWVIYTWVYPPLMKRWVRARGF